MCVHVYIYISICVYINMYIHVLSMFISHEGPLFSFHVSSAERTRSGAPSLLADVCAVSAPATSYNQVMQCGVAACNANSLIGVYAAAG